MADDSGAVGVVYVAFGENYQHETQRSLKSLQSVSSVETAVITDRPWTGAPQPNYFIIRQSVPSFRCKPLYIYDASPFKKTLFLDTDTIVGRDISPVFGLLQHYDIGVRFGGPQLNEPAGLKFHTQCNSGVILFRKCDEVAAVWHNWLRLYDAAADKVASDERGGIGDQRYLAIAIAESRARPVQLAEFINFTLFDNIITCTPPIIYHGRASWMEMLASSVNRSWKQDIDWHARVWLPNIAGFLPRGLRRSDPLLGAALLCRRAYNEVRWRCGITMRQKNKR